MKKVLSLVMPLLRSKKFQTGVVTVLASLIVRIVGLDPELASQISEAILKVGLVLIGAQGVADGFSGGKTSSNGPDPDAE